jgi:hypothetical protein
MMQTPEVHLLLLSVRLAGAINIKAFWFRVDAWEFIQIKEAKTKDEIALVGSNIFG